MHFVVLFLFFLFPPKSLAQFVVTAHDPIIEEFRNAINNSTARGLFGFDVKNFLKKNGYPFENHEITTEDGYVLAIHRIPYGRDSSKSKFDDEIKPAVLLMHGTGSSSVDFMLSGPEKSLPLLLADQGYDVWLGNNRGNTWSRKHITLDPDKNDTFWDFSFHERGLYDSSSIIDHIINVTGNEKISYIGHSQGSTQFFALVAERPEYNDKVNIMMALGPAVYCQNLSNPIVQILKDHYTIVEFVTNYLNMTEVLGHSFIIETALKLLCKDGSQYQEICPLVLFLMFGFDSPQFDRSIMTTMLDSFPSGFSIKELKHYLQLVKSGLFRQYDHGILNNLEIYNQSAPPDYDISRVTAPVALYYGKNDWLVAISNVDRLADELPNLVEKHLIEYDYFNHIDFITATDVVPLLYFDLINKLNDIHGMDPFTTPKTTPTTSTIAPTPGNTTSSDVSSIVTTTDPNTDSVTPGSAFSFNSYVHISCIYMLIIVKFIV